LFKVFPLLVQLPLQVLNHGSKLGLQPPTSPGFAETLILGFGRAGVFLRAFRGMRRWPMVL